MKKLLLTCVGRAASTLTNQAIALNCWRRILHSFSCFYTSCKWGPDCSLSRPFFQRCLCSEWPWKTEIGTSLGRKGRHVSYPVLRGTTSLSKTKWQICLPTIQTLAAKLNRRIPLLHMPYISDPLHTHPVGTGVEGTCI